MGENILPEYSEERIKGLGSHSQGTSNFRNYKKKKKERKKEKEN